MGTWIVGAIVVIIIGLVVYKLYKDRKNGKSCTCGCDSCSACPGGCDSHNKAE